jgi:type I pantothenate kinase
MQGLYAATDTFLGTPAARVPYVIGIAGSVAVGKSTTARILRALLARWPNHRRVDLVTTDGFLYPNRVLKAQGLMDRKGFPESYDLHQPRSSRPPSMSCASRRPRRCERR